MLLAFSIVWNQAVGIAIFRSGPQSTRKGLVTLGVVVDVGLLGYFKYYDFFVSSGHNAARLGRPRLPARHPLDRPARRASPSSRSWRSATSSTSTGASSSRSTLTKFGAYLSFFPHLVAGPIVRGSELLPQLETPRDPRRVDTARAFYLIGTGLFKKVVIANYLATHIVDQVFGAPVQHSSLETWVAVYGYAVQIYADFSGYTDMAIGLALLLGFKFPQNFDSPYTAVSIQDFWRRWHMTLSRWLRDYVYIPLGGNRKGEPRTYLNLMATMLIGGLWHGAAWSFVIWGGLQGMWLAVGRFRREHGLAEDATTGWALWRQRIITFQLVCFAWIFFRAGSENGLSTAWEIIKRLFDNWGTASPLVTSGVVLAIVVGIGTQYLPAPDPADDHGALLAGPGCVPDRLARPRADGLPRHGPAGRRPLHLLPLLAVDTPTRTRSSRRRRRRGDDRVPSGPLAGENGSGRGPRRKLHPAGQAIVVGIGALVLAAFLNAPGLHKTAESLDPGWKRSVALPLTENLETVSHYTGLDLPRRGVKAALGRSSDDDIVSAIVLPPAPPPVAPQPSPPPHQNQSPPTPAPPAPPPKKRCVLAVAPAARLHRRRLARDRPRRLAPPRDGEQGLQADRLGRRPRRDRARAAGRLQLVRPRSAT